MLRAAMRWKELNRMSFAALVRGTAVAAATLMLTGCAGSAYYWQSLQGQLDLMNRSRPVAEVVADALTPAGVKAKLELSQRIRSFAAAELHLPDNPSYRRYADLHRSAAVWNVVAAPPFSLKLKTWCFPITGCIGYHGYFRQADAQAEAERLKAEGLEVSVYGVPAYSTLGWMNWAGGDPLLSTFIHYPEGELARLIFHELSHQVVYAPGDTMFNESFATAVERLGSQRWLRERASEAARLEYARFDQRRQAFRALALATRRQLALIYKTHNASSQADSPFLAIDNIAMEIDKERTMHQFRERYQTLKASWGGFAGYDPWVARANNAAFGAQAAYDDLVPGFEALFAREGGDWLRFYDAVRRLAAMPRTARHEALQTHPTESIDG